MARTKQSAHKNVSPCTPPSSSSSYQFIERSPSPPPRPTPPHTSSASPSSNTSQEVLNLISLSTILPPLYTLPTPNFAQVPPHLHSESNDSSDSCPPVAKTPTQPEPPIKRRPQQQHHHHNNHQQPLNLRHPQNLPSPLNRRNQLLHIKNGDRSMTSFPLLPTKKNPSLNPNHKLKS
uniref:Rho GTPase-activating protein gacR-like n=1 Tax=Cicer arietinum TaxID=3827 RepID=A0A1S3EH54_CICAR|nr:rho GTPase-activating protein gacR-like [Cicer arietinum]